MKTYRKKPNAKVKDSVFTNLFSEPVYAKELVEYLHPELAPVSAENLEMVTLGNVLTTDLYNDLAIMMQDRMMIFVEQQSTYNPNIALRMQLYASETIKNYLAEHPEKNTFLSRRITIPEIELFCICTYERKMSYPDCETFGNVGSIFSNVKMIYPKPDESNIVSQYVAFAQSITGLLLLPADSKERLEMLAKHIDKCIKNGILSVYLQSHKKEVLSMLDVINNQKIVTQCILNEAKEIAREEGLAEGKAEGLLEGKAEGKAQGLLEGKAEGKAQGLLEGKAEGKAEGLLEGKAEGRLETYIDMLKTAIAKQNFSVEQAIDFFDIPKELAAEIRKKLCEK